MSELQQQNTISPADQAVMKVISDLMAAELSSQLSPGETCELLPSVSSGTALIALLAHGPEGSGRSLGYANTAANLDTESDTVGDIEVLYYLDLMDKAIKKSGLTEEQLGALYERNKHVIIRPYD